MSHNHVLVVAILRLSGIRVDLEELSLAAIITIVNHGNQKCTTSQTQEAQRAFKWERALLIEHGLFVDTAIMLGLHTSIASVVNENHGPLAFALIFTDLKPQLLEKSTELSVVRILDLSNVFVHSSKTFDSISNLLNLLAIFINIRKVLLFIWPDLAQVRIV